MQEPAIPEGELDRLAALYSINILDTSREERFDRISRVLKEVFDVPIAYIAMIDSDRQWFKSVEGMNMRETPRNISFCGHTILRNDPLIILDATKDVRFMDNPLVVGEPGIRFYAGWPLALPGGHNVGSLCMVDKQPRENFTEKCRRIMGDLAAMVEDQLALTDMASIQENLQAAKAELEKRNAFIREVFGRYMADELVDSLLEDPTALTLGGQCRTVTIMMVDLRGFTPLTTVLDPEKTVEALNIYFEAMLGVVTRFGGTVDNIMGDGLMILFGVPNQKECDACAAIACAIEMQNAMKQVNEKLNARNLPELGIGIGINSGEVVVGNVGSKNFAKYSAIGSPVNITARIEAHSLPGQILVTEAALQEADANVKTVGSLRVKAKGVKRIYQNS